MRWLSRAIAGRMRSRCRPPGYRSSGLKFEVVTKPTPLSNSATSSRCRIIASVMSATWNSSKQISL
ncbi:hypothetical protein D3C78_1891050 [compost metagenome]